MPVKFAIWLRNKSVWIIGSLLVFVGAIGIWRCPNAVGLRLSEALFIAGCLGLSVDWWLKRKLQEDAARDIFHHLMGIDLPEDLRTKVQGFVEENEIYRNLESIQAHAQSTPSGVTLTIKMEATIVAARDAIYRPRVEFEEPLNAVILEASLRSSPAGKNYYSYNGGMRLTDGDELMVKQWTPSPKTIALSKGNELQYYVKYEVTRSNPDFYIIFFGMSSLRPRVRVTASDDLEIFASKDENTLQNGDEYAHKGVFLRAQHIQIRWRTRLASATL